MVKILKEEVVNFVDKYVTCQNDKSIAMEDLVNLQIHGHAKTCKKMGHQICGFNFPLPPMQRTMILTPLDDSDTLCPEKQRYIKETAEKIKTELDIMKFGEDISFQAFLDKLGLTEENHLLALRRTLKRDTHFLKRKSSEIRINNYNTTLLKAWQANMDLQYVLDPYSCATYILAYITKGQRGISRLLEKATEEIKSGNQDIANKVRHIGNKFLNAVEISAQEAAYLVLQVPMRRSTHDFQFINTSNPDERAFLLKSLDKLKELPDNSPDIESDNLIKRYQRRPKQLENVCSADFAACFNCVREKASNKVPCTSSNDFLPETNDDDIYDTIDNTSANKNEYNMRGGIKLVKRCKPKIICLIRFHKDRDPENYYREQLMLYTPWRKESTDLLAECETYAERFEQLNHIIHCNSQQYECHNKILQEAIDDFNSDYCDRLDNVAPN